MGAIEEHFDAIAPKYDEIKRHSWYYYDNLKKLYRSLIPTGKVVLEIGCGTGDILAATNPARGIGIDISHKMIEKAKEKYGNRAKFRFYHIAAEGFETTDRFNYIFLSDVIEHLEHLKETVDTIARLADERTTIVISMANPLWEPILMILEKLKLKMEEGPHYRISFRVLKKLLEKNNLFIEKHGFRQILPFYIPFLSPVANNVFYRIPLISRLGLTEYLVIKKVL